MEGILAMRKHPSLVERFGRYRECGILKKILYGRLMGVKEIPDFGHARQLSFGLYADFLNGLMYCRQIKPFSTSGRSLVPVNLSMV